MSVKDEIKYLIDENGVRTAVVVPINEWKSMSKNIQEFEEYIFIKKSLKQGFEEAEQMASGKMESKTLTNFLNEL